MVGHSSFAQRAFGKTFYIRVKVFVLSRDVEMAEAAMRVFLPRASYAP